MTTRTNTSTAQGGAKHTHGPWKAVVVKNEGAKIITTSSFEPSGKTVAWVPADDTAQLASGRIVERMSEHAQADARLISQAPAMREALRKIVDRASDEFPMGDSALRIRKVPAPLIDNARAILAAIEGQS